ncbi:uncharacterized protein LOC116210345 isoform X2 [Punica granatum]|uniref:Uncharacterized protein LOC116210345 isoform X2 n=1 Tax=Punica granatum TaxID=22663 RepID=A0A218WUH5_PUNGR|nr:uncharacterized protein LOC116210345 isoform X2 [Punica granatum]OWM76313.1 hypothetical protein CDL15_Pgr009959 [Punica granatum]
MLEDISYVIASVGEIAGDAGAAVESPVGYRTLAALAVGIGLVFVLLVCCFLTTLDLGRGCTRSCAFTWKVGKLRVLRGFNLSCPWTGTSFILVTILSAFNRAKGFFGISSYLRSPKPSVDVGHIPEKSGYVACDNICSRALSPSTSRTDNLSLGESDLKELISLINERDGGPSWQLLMERANSALLYQAWYRDPPVGPMQCRTRTVFENVSPELLRDFFWDDEFRTKWDKMLVYFKTLCVCPHTGTMVVHWIRKLSIIGSEKEYIIVRRIWESNSNYYCITKAASYPTLPKSTTRRRIELYYSSWLIKAVKSRNGKQGTASEVLFFHWEDLGIPRELMKMGARAGMWGLVKRMHLGLQAYKNLTQARISSPSTYSLLARMTTKFELQPNMNTSPCSEANTGRDEKRRKHERGPNAVKWLVLGGLLVVSGLTLKANGTGIVCEAAKWLQMFCRRRKQPEEGRHRDEERIRP